ncbi:MULTISPECIES: lipopolysaccharide assembly protein LapA domain-containing protein [unclassified Nocardia]|uniref:LapA family protein n=1 Tax=unclassified Nocardia TaxID=2637762 RepID=UPI0024A957AC|nr:MULTISPECIES: lipopolysaccharide assembly protein LapA domain-containing protein [unclassified Nocardia]
MTADAVNPGDAEHPEPEKPIAEKQIDEKQTDTRKPDTSIDRALKTRTGYTWLALIIAALLGIVLLVFILQNLETAHVEFFAWRFQMPIGVLVLLSVIIGALVMALVGGWRIFQLRRAAKKAG